MLSLACLVLWALGPAAAVAQRASLPAGGQSPHGAAYKRWAVLSSTAVEETGLGDLLSAELSTRDGLEMVERDQLELATAELELDALFGSGAAGRRLKLGRLLKADALILISFQRPAEQPAGTPERPPREEPEEPPYVKLVISDCIYGARLCIELFPYAPDQREHLAGQIASLVETTRRRFAGGIERMISVSHFVSKNLTHEFDHLQAGYAYLLESALVSLPNVAVVEMEEALAVGAELAMAGEVVEDPVVPLLVDGEFEMSRAAPGDEPSVHLLVRVSDGSRLLRQFERDELTLAEARDLLTAEIPSLVADLLRSGTAATVPRTQRKEALLARADTFEALGAWDHATGLREAALVLTPDDWELRLLLIGSYRRLWRRDQISLGELGVSGRLTSYNAEHFQRRWEQLGPEEKMRVTQIRERLLARWRISMQHVEAVVRARKVSPREAALLLWMVPSNLAHWALPIAQRDEVDDELHDFYWRMYALFPTLDPSIEQGACRASVVRSVGADRSQGSGRRSAEKQHDEWVGNAIARILSRGQGRRIVKADQRGVVRPVSLFDGRQALEDLYRLLTEYASQEMPPVATVGILLTAGPESDSSIFREILRGKFTLAEVRAFYQRLRESKQPLNVFYGRAGQLAIDYYSPLQREPGKDLLAEADALLEWLDQRGCNPKTMPDGRKPDHYDINLFVHTLRSLRGKFARDASPPTAAGRRRHSWPQNPIRETGLSPRVVFQRVPEVKPSFDGLAQCTDTMDVMASPHTVYVMRRKGAVEPIYRTDGQRRRLRQVVWDGQCFWIAVAHSEVDVVSPDGALLGGIGPPQGLPPDTALFLHPIEPGKCLAIGRRSADGRQWFAVLSRPSGEAGCLADVFYRALKTSDKPIGKLDEELHSVFHIGWAAEYRTPASPGRRLLLLGAAGYPTPYRRPLAIDLETLDVSFFQGKLPADHWRDFDVVRGNRFYSTGKGLLWVWGGVNLLLPPTDPNEEEWSRKKLGREPTAARILPCQGKLYVPGPNWFRFDPQTAECDKLTEKPLPKHFVFASQYGVSAHYGLVAWGDEEFYRVSIDPEKPPPLDLAQLYPRVPPERREQHHRAVEAIKKLGGSVGTTERQASDQVAVYLPRKWKGGVEGLAHLNDLHNLTILHLMGVPIDDDSLQRLSELETLHTLYLFGTEVTNQGLAHLGQFPRLSGLHLESTSLIDDAGLGQIGKERRLQRLALYGYGFTDAALGHLDGMSVHLVELYHTAITRPAVAEFVKSRPRLTISYRTY